MAIDSVLYKNGDIEEEIHIDSIERHKEFGVVRKNLFCAFTGCEARIEYVPQGKKKAYFKTWPLQNHTEDCLDYFEREQKRKSEKGSATVNVPLSQKHIDNILNSIYKAANETEEEKNSRLEKQRNKKRVKNKTVDASQPSQPSLNINPTTGEEENAIGDLQRAPSVKRRLDVQLLNESDVGYARAIYGVIESIEVGDQYVSIILSSNGKKCKVNFEEAFFASAAINALGMFRNVENALSEGLKLELTGVGEVVQREGEVQAVIGNQNHFKLNNYRLGLFSLKYLDGEL